ncbi:MAG TPA: hypothetical protein VFE53_04130 [Mucilaginibacter sp.]|jgi:hypothetical protein|nr:hypothetical protein [Mucilaginibacter sp.]
MEILIFKTDVTSRKKATRVGRLLASVQTIKQWTIDLEDCDKVLRVVATRVTPGFVESLLMRAGFNCSVLD